MNLRGLPYCFGYDNKGYEFEKDTDMVVYCFTHTLWRSKDPDYKTYSDEFEAAKICHYADKKEFIKKLNTYLLELVGNDETRVDDDDSWTVVHLQTVRKKDKITEYKLGFGRAAFYKFLKSGRKAEYKDGSTEEEMYNFFSDVTSYSVNSIGEKGEIKKLTVKVIPTAFNLDKEDVFFDTENIEKFLATVPGYKK